MDKFTDPLIESISLCFGAQIGKTEAELNMIGYALHQTASPVMMVYPTDTIAKFASDKRVQPMIRSVEPLADMYDESSKLLELDFVNGNYMVLVGANSPSSLSSRSIKYLFFDEIDKYPAFSGKEANPIKLAEERTKTFVDKKIVRVSTPTIESGNIWQSYMDANERKQYYVPCPHCGVSQTLKFKQIKWPEEHHGNADMIRDTAYYECENCKQRIDDKHKMDMLRQGEWRAVNESQVRVVRSVAYHMSSLYSPWVTFGDVAYEFVKSKDKPSELMNFINSGLAEPWKSAKTKSTQNLVFTQSEVPRGTVPQHAPLLIASVDVQQDHFWWEVRAYAHGVSSYLVDYGQASSWSDLTEILIDREYPSEYGEARKIVRAGIDSGYRTDEVYQYCAQYPEVCVPVKGDSSHSPLAPPYKMSSIEKGVIGGMKLYVVNTDYWKDFIFARMVRPANEPGTIHLFKDCPEEYSEHLRSEEKQEIRNVKTGAVTVQWKPLTSHPTNHLLDTCVYNAMVADSVGVKYLPEYDPDTDDEDEDTDAEDFNADSRGWFS
jgi:phage terminase large subunit GpA-like protein